jgi:hypothetical protein
VASQDVGGQDVGGQNAACPKVIRQHMVSKELP